MQTFVTNSTKTFGLEDLDSKRLNKQLLECRQILNILVTLRNNPDAKIGWRNHPAVKMWIGCEWFFYSYITQVATEAYEVRGIAVQKNMDAIRELYNSYEWDTDDVERRPVWWTDPVALDRVITTHRASLYHKDETYYPQFKTEADFVDNYRAVMVCCDRCQYYWPSHVA